MLFFQEHNRVALLAVKYGLLDQGTVKFSAVVICSPSYWEDSF